MKRRTFLKNTSLTVGAVLASTTSAAQDIFSYSSPGQTAKSLSEIKPLVISSSNEPETTRIAMDIILQGKDALDGVIAGVNTVEDNPNDHSVGYGGLPNEKGIVELDACCMHGPTHNAGAVASLRNIKNPSKVARLVMERTDHVLLVGEGALEFAKAHGFREENLLTEEAREIWLYWKESLSDKDSWFSPGNSDNIPEHIKKFFNITGTITCLGMDLKGNISGVTTTSGKAFKIPGRVGDSPIIGAGLYVDNEVGACGSIGRGEENLKNLSSFLVVEKMRMGFSPEDACFEVIDRIIKHAKLASLLDSDGNPNFNISFFALNKNGEFAGASLYGPANMTVNDGKQNRVVEIKSLYERK
ncbi:MAG: N(4)-(beta-N-acetylglucosaminyl)-L-asparaginase [Ignavibacteriaceae bacterium]